ncbi:molecular chaperone [Achromobacter sp.]|uniref:fimbrial biogenesis chaperone n=1 Tax=Achromobacter sp. TaxID=134375 RepID=UPI0028AF5F0A|nr:molecular chaperone [Achromobacter sp.]
MFLVYLRTALAVLLTCTAASANAGVVITGTRVVYLEGSREVSIRMRNADEKPLLVQAWIDDGSINESPAKLDVPFLVTPPMSRVEPKKGQTLRIVYVGADLPRDRESLYFLNVLEVPPKTERKQDENYMQLAVRTRLKLFLRPSGLPTQIEEAPKALSWELTAKGQVHVHNPTPYHVTFSRVQASIAGTQVVFNQDMVPPFGSLELTRAAGKTADKVPVEVNQVRFGVINDYGAEVQTQAELRSRQ